MGIIDKAVRRHINKIKRDNPYEYNSIIAPDRLEALRDRYTRSILVNSVWYGGNDMELKQLYQRDLKAFRDYQFTSDELNYFWANDTSGTNIRKVHTGIPQLISEKMVDVILANGYEYNVYEDENYEDRDEDNQARLDNILWDNKFALLIQEAIETESWAGGVAFKLSTNKAISKYPILEVIQPEEYEPVIKAGRIIGDIFITYYTHSNTSYKLKEHYGVDDKGAFIRYMLYRYANDEWIEESLSTLEETKDLKDMSFPGVYKKFSLYKPNKLPNSEFRGSRMGESDYSGSVGMFDALDEILSTMVQEFRDGKIKNWWSSNLLPVDPSTNEAYIPPALKKDFIVYNSGIGEKEQPTKFEQTQGQINAEKYIIAYKKALETILNNAGLSPTTVGLSGIESTAASADSQELREKTTIRTREKKIDIWQPTLEELFELLLVMDDIKNGRGYREYHIKVIFNDYKITTIEERTDIAGKGLASGSWDLKTAIDYVHDDLTDEERVLLRVNAKIEKGINVFTKEEELIYRKFVQEVENEVDDTPPELEEIEPEDVEDVVENDTA